MGSYVAKPSCTWHRICQSSALLTVCTIRCLTSIDWTTQSRIIITHGVKDFPKHENTDWCNAAMSKEETISNDHTYECYDQTFWMWWTGLECSAATSVNLLFWVFSFRHRQLSSGLGCRSMWYVVRLARLTFYPEAALLRNILVTLITALWLVIVNGTSFSFISENRFQANHSSHH